MEPYLSQIMYHLMAIAKYGFKPGNRKSTAARAGFHQMDAKDGPTDFLHQSPFEREDFKRN